MMENLKEILEDELKKIAKKGDIDPQELDGAYKAVDILKDLETIKAMREAYPEEGQYSQRGGSYNSYARGNYSNASYSPIWNADQYMPEHSMNNGMRGSYADGMSNAGRVGRDGDGDGRYSEDYSNRRGRDARGRYTSRDGSYESSYDGSYERGYSRHSEKKRMIDKLETMADVASDAQTKRAIEQCIEKLEK